MCWVYFDEQELRCHLPNPGRMEELLHPNESVVLIRLAPIGSDRKTDATIVALFDENQVINLDTQLFSKLIPYIVNQTKPSYFKGWRIRAHEVSINHHRIDFLMIDQNDEEVYTEIKSTTRVIDGIACFPDAVSKRAKDHLIVLERLSEDHRSMVIFTVYRRANSFKPCENIDPDFAKLFYKTMDKIDYLAIQLQTELIEKEFGYVLLIDEDGLIEIS